MADTAEERDELERLAHQNAIALLRRWMPEGELRASEYHSGTFVVHTGYGSWTTSNGQRGHGFVRLRAAQKGWRQDQAARDLRSALEDLGALERSAAPGKGAKKSKHTAIVPVPDDAVKIDWDVLSKNEVAWRRLGMKCLPTAWYAYRDANGSLLGYSVRFDPPGDPKLVLRLLWCGSHTGWQLTDFPKPYPIFNQEKLVERPDAKVLVVEGEKACLAAEKRFPEYVAVTWPNGAVAVRHAAWGVLQGREVIIWPDADDPGKQAALELSSHLRRFRVKRVSTVELPVGLPRGWDLADEPPPGFDIAQAMEDAGKVHGVIEELNQKFAVVNDNGQIVVYNEEREPRTGIKKFQKLTFTDFRNMFNNREVMVGADNRGNPIFKTMGDFWIEHPDRRQYQGVCYEPDYEEPGFLNLWQGFAITPKPGDWTLLHEHLLNNICTGNREVFEYVLNWCARCVQKPGEPGQVALVMRGRRGTGKGIFAQALGKIFGNHFQHISNSKHLVGHFNAHLRYASLVFADEGYWAGDKQGESSLKTLITEKRLTIEAKGRDAFSVTNTIHLIIASNNDWVVPAGPEERRFCVMDVSESHMQDNKYFSRINAQLDAGGHEAFFYDLLNRDISEFDVYDVPQTRALLEQKLLSLSIEQGWWLDILQSAKLPGDLNGTGEASYDLMLESFYTKTGKTSPHGRAADRKLLEFLRRYLPEHRLQISAVRGPYKKVVGVEQDGSPKLQVSHGRIVHLPALEVCRKGFEKMFGQSMDWSLSAQEWQAAEWKEEEPPF